MADLDLVLLPGMDGTGFLFEPFVNALPSGINPIVVAYPTNKPLSYKELLPVGDECPAQEEPLCFTR